MAGLIGLIGYKGSGKTEVTLHASAMRMMGIRDKIVRMGFADPIVDMLIAFGVPEDFIADKKNWDTRLNMLGGKTIRYAAQTLGTEWGRNIMSPDLWATRAMLRVDMAKPDELVILDNVRFHSELDSILAAGGALISFVRPQLRVNLEHASEQGIEALQAQAHYTFVNDFPNVEHAAVEFLTFLASHGLLR